MKPLVSILIPAYNAERTIVDTLRSSLDQTWPNKEIIVVNDGSTDDTGAIIERFASKNVRVVHQQNKGLSGAQNRAFKESSGDYIQWLDADDKLAPDKLERQLAALRPGDSKRVVLSSPWAPFYYRTRNARFVKNSVWEDLPPVEWLLRKLRDDIHMQNATWLISREVTEAAGPWMEDLFYDQDGEYFARVLLASEGTRFVPGTGIFYRVSPANRISYLGNSDRKKESMVVSMTLHIQYLRSLEDSERVRRACLSYIKTWYPNFYPTHPDLCDKLKALAAEVGGPIDPPPIRRKYAWIEPIFGLNAAAWAQRTFPELKSSCLRKYDGMMHRLELLRANTAPGFESKS